MFRKCVRHLIGVDWEDLKKAEEIYYALPSCMHFYDVIGKLYSLSPDEDVCASLLQWVADYFFCKHKIKIDDVDFSGCDSYFEHSNETRKHIESLASKGDEMANFILRHSE